MTRAFNVIIERDAEGYFVASVPELRGCHTQAKSLDTLMEPIREAIELSAFNAFGLTDDQTVAQVRCVRLVLR